MEHSEKNRGLLKKAIATVLGITMAFGAFALPCDTIKGGFVNASAYECEAVKCKYTYHLTHRSGIDGICITNAEFTGDTLEIPSAIEHNGKSYPVTEIGEYFLNENKQIKTIIVPDSVTYIDRHFLYKSSVEKIVLSNKLEHIDMFFAAECQSLTEIECSSINISPTELGAAILDNCPKYKSENGTVCIANMLVRYIPPKGTTKLRISDLNSGDIKIDRLADAAISNCDDLTTLDLEGIKYIDNSNFSACPKLTEVINADELNFAGDFDFYETPWLENFMSQDLAKLGNVLFYYKTYDNVLDLTKGKLAGVKNVRRGALVDNKNIDTFYCDPDCYFGYNSLYMNHDQTGKDECMLDMIPFIPTYNVKEVYLGKNKLTYDLIREDRAAYDWLRVNAYNLKGSAFVKKIVEDKTKELFRQMDIPYYGINNDKMGTHTPTEEFYIRLKIHDFISQYGYEDDRNYNSPLSAFLLGTNTDSFGCAYLTLYLLECAGIDSMSLNGGNNNWTTTKIGDQWFECDDAMDAQVDEPGYTWFGLSTKGVDKKDKTTHTFEHAFDSFHAMNKYDNALSERMTAKITLGDVDGDNDRDQEDADKLWSYLKGETKSVDKNGGDINFDGKIDVNDGVLLDYFVKGTAFDLNDRPVESSAPGYWVAFINGKDYDNIRYLHTDKEGNITLPADLFEAPEGKKLSYDKGKAGQTIKITTPLTIVNVKWEDAITTDFMLGDVNDDKKIDIEDAVAIIQHINGVTALTADEEKRADVSKDNNIDIDDAVTIISYINGNSTF